jgi:molybdopterin-dependent oxidoreductase alpha subunit
MTDDRDAALVPLDDTDRIAASSPANKAGGIPAVVSTTRHAVGKMGVRRTIQTLLKLNQVDGFDCPGCAWPDPLKRSVVEFCENGAKAVADEATTARIGPDFFARHDIADLAARSDHWLNAQGRIAQPMVLEPGASNYRPITWDDAFELIGQTLAGLDSPDEAIFYTSGRTSNEAAFLYQLFVRAFGTNNLPDCSNMCHESSGVGLGEVIGIGKGTVLLEDFERAGAIFVIGQNPGTNHPRMLTALQEAKRAGATIVTVNPLREPGLERFGHPQEVSGILGKGTPLTDLFLRVRINGDVALLKGLCKATLELGAVDQAFIDDKTDGFDALVDDLEATSWSDIVEASGIPRDQIVEAAKIAADADGVIVCWAMGLTQHENGVANVQSVVNFLLLGGNIGRPGAGACPVRGHSNVQGDRTVGIVERPPAHLIESLGRVFDIDVPKHHGTDTVAAIEAMHDGSAKVFFGMGGNFLSATPDTLYTAEAMRRCDLTIHVSTKLNRSHLVHGKRALILSCLGRTELDMQASGPQFVTVENSMGIVHTSQGRLRPASDHLMSEPAIVARMARATLGPDHAIDWEGFADDYDRIRDAIEACIPGFDDYNERVRKPGGFVLPNGPRDGVFPTETGRARFTVHPIPRHELPPGGFLMMTIRSHDQYNTTIYGLDDRYRGIRDGRRVVFLHPDDIAAEGFSEGELVDLVGHPDTSRVAKQFRIVAYDMPRRSAATYFPEANVLVPIDSFAHRSRTPTSKSVPITLERSQA